MWKPFRAWAGGKYRQKGFKIEVSARIWLKLEYIYTTYMYVCEGLLSCSCFFRFSPGSFTDDVGSLRKQCDLFIAEKKKVELGCILMELGISISMSCSLECPSSFC